MAITTSSMLSELYTKKFGKGKYKIKSGKGKSYTKRKKKKKWESLLGLSLDTDK